MYLLNKEYRNIPLCLDVDRRRFIFSFKFLTVCVYVYQNQLIPVHVYNRRSYTYCTGLLESILLHSYQLIENETTLFRAQLRTTLFTSITRRELKRRSINQRWPSRPSHPSSSSCITPRLIELIHERKNQLVY